MRPRRVPGIFVIIVFCLAAFFWIVTRVFFRVSPRRTLPAAGVPDVSVRNAPVQSSAENREEKKDLRCTIVGISYNKTNPLVVIENNAYVPGDSVCGGTIAGINREKVTVKFRKTEKSFMIGDRIAE